MDPFALPCHPDLRLDTGDRDWRAVGVKSPDGVRRKATRCPECKTTWTAFERTFPAAVTVEWLQSVPFRVHATAVDGAPAWQDAVVGGAGMPEAPVVSTLAELQQQTASLPDWQRSAQLVSVVEPLTAGGQVFAVPGDRLLERREKWNAQDRRLALLWSPRLGGPVVAWHGFARLLQETPVS